jgi:polyisoprenoid-binding protein YceI
MRIIIFGIGGLISVLFLSSSRAQSPAPSVYTINPARSRIGLTVSRSGLLKMIGHDHAIAATSFAGQVRYDPENIGNSSVQINIDAGSLAVLEDPGVSEKDRIEIQANMEGQKVLDIRQFPKILFHSTEVRRTAIRDGLMLWGRLQLHGMEKDIAFPVQIHTEANRLRVTGTAVLSQTDFGIRPIKAAAGGLKVKDQITVKLEILAEKAG